MSENPTPAANNDPVSERKEEMANIWAGHEHVGPASRMIKDGPDGVWGSRVLQFAGQGRHAGALAASAHKGWKARTLGALRAFPELIPSMRVPDRRTVLQIGVKLFDLGVTPIHR